MPSLSAARAIAVASIGSDFPGCRAARLEDSVSPGATRTTRSPLETSPRSRRPDTCRQSSTAHTRSSSSSAANRNASSVPSSLAGIVSCPRASRLPHRARQACATACVCPPQSRSSAPSLRWLWPTERISGGHTSVGAMPASYQVTPAILGGGGRHGKSRSDPERSTGEIKSQPAAVREPNRRAGRHRPPETRFSLRRIGRAARRSRLRPFAAVNSLAVQVPVVEFMRL